MRPDERGAPPPPGAGGGGGEKDFKRRPGAERSAYLGVVNGKTGAAEVAGGSHSWFIGNRGDLASATLLVRGGSSDNAVAVTRDMLAALPPGTA